MEPSLARPEALQAALPPPCSTLSRGSVVDPPPASASAAGRLQPNVASSAVERARRERERGEQERRCWR
eukprot:2546424-Prymnesium_polylepis.2